MRTIHLSIVALMVIGAVGCFGNSSSAPTEPAPHIKHLQEQSAASPSHATEDPHESDGGSSNVRSLIEGNTRFVARSANHPHQDSDRRLSLAGSQAPFAAVLSCSDSRVPPEVVFDQGLGDLFVVRTAGEVADSAALASLEYAVEHLGVKLIVVMGHLSCGAVKATLTTAKGKSAGSPSLDSLVGAIRPHIEGMSVESAGQNLENAVVRQVNGVAKDLTQKSKILHEASEKHGLKIARAAYHLDTGVVQFLD